MTGRTLERRLRAMEERMGGDDPLRASSDLDLLRVIEAVATHLAATGDAAAMATLADHDAQEAAWRAFQERPDIARSHVPMLDYAALRIVKLSEPFAPLPKTQDDPDVLHVTRTWQFMPGGELIDR